MNIGTVGIVNPPRIIRTDAHVVPLKGVWAVKMEHNTVYSGIFYTQMEATSYAIRMARMAASSVVIHAKDGSVRQVWSYDSNPRSRM